MGLSAQTIRNYESWGIIPQAERGEQGYRLYTEKHLEAMRITRIAIKGFGWSNGCHIMQCIHRNDTTAALFTINARHAELHHQRMEVESMLKIFQKMASGLPPSEQPVRQRRLFYIHEAAREAGVRVSALRYWEERGLLHPIRDQQSRYRLYDETQVLRLQIVTLLRKTGYDFAAIEAVLAQIATGTIEEAMHAAESRLRELTEQSRDCIQATAVLWKYIEALTPPV